MYNFIFHMHRTCLLSIHPTSAKAQVQAKAKMTYLLVLHRKNKIFEGLFQNFKITALFEIVVRTGILNHKIFVFVQVLFLCYAVPSFAVQSYFCTYVATTKPVMLLVTPKHNADIFFMYATGRNPDCASINLQKRSKSSLKWSKTG